MASSGSATWVGIDVSKDWLDVAILPTNHTFQVPNAARGWAQVITTLTGTPAPLIVLEATGPYHRAVTVALATAELPVAVVNPAWIAWYRRAEGKRTKTDRTDAQLLARYAADKQPSPTPLLPESARQLKELQGLRDDLTGELVATQNRRATASPLVQPFLDEGSAELTSRRARVDQTIADLLAREPALAERAAALTTVPGLGPTLVPGLLAHLPELGQVTAKQIASLAGVAPHLRQSGKFKGMAFIGGGRPAVRRILYLMALTAVRASRTKPDAPMRVFYLQLLARGKARTLALIAVAHKMVGIINAMLRDGLTWQQTRVGQGHVLPTPP